MDTKSLAKSKRAHSQHHKKHHPNQKAKSTTSSVGTSTTDKGPVKAVNEKPRQKTKLPSNWDRYEDEDDPMTANQIDGQSSQPSEIAVPKSKGADYAYLISEAKSQNSTRISSEIFPSLDDFVSDFGQGKEFFFAARGESLLSSLQNDRFFVDDKTPASYEASFLSLNLHALSAQLAKIDLPKRLFMEAHIFPSELYSEEKKEIENSTLSHDDVNRNELEAYDHQEVASNSNPRFLANPSENQLKFEAETVEAELDMLLDSFADANVKDKTSTPILNGQKTVAFDIDGTLDDLLNETSNPALIGALPPHEVKSIPIGSVSTSSQPVSRSELLDEFDSWLDTI